MSKYDVLWEYIKQNECNSITFDEAEKVLGFAIDHSFLTYKKELLYYGYSVGKISMKDKKITINKLN